MIRKEKEMIRNEKEMIRNEKEMIRNEYHVKFAQLGMYAGKECVFTHRNPKTDEVWGEDIPNGREFGKWVDKRKVKFI